MADPKTADPDYLERNKRRIRKLAAEIAALSRRDLSTKAYYAEFLARVLDAISAVGGALWSIDESGTLSLTYHVNLRASTLHAAGEHQTRHAQLLYQVAQHGKPALIPPHSGSGDESEGANPTELLLVLAPLQVDSRVTAVVEVFQRPTTSSELAEGYQTFLSSMAAHASDFLTRRRLREHRRQEALWQRKEALARCAHESLNLRQTGYTLACEGQRLIGCDRVSIALRRPRRCRIEAISGQETVNARANLVRLMAGLATTVANLGEPLWYHQEEEPALPQVSRALQDYLEESHTKTVAVVPLRAPRAQDSFLAADESTPHDEQGEVIGALIVEQIEDQRSQEELAPQVEFVAAHAERALSNALAYNRVFLLPLWRVLGNTRALVHARALPKTIAALLVLVAVVSALVFIPARFDLAGRGVLRPAEQRDVFVDTEGVVEEVLVEHGSAVRQGEPLVRLTNTQLEVQLAKVLGEKQSTAERIAAVDRARHQPGLAAEEKNRLAGELSILKQQHRSLEQQYALLHEKINRLTILSPLDGQVITWDLKQNLLHRPVSRGQVLLTVADPEGRWELEVHMPEHRMGHITAARNGSADPLEVEYVVATAPTEQFVGTLREVHSAAELHEEHGHSVNLIVDIDRRRLRNPRPGATVTAQVHCGMRPLGYVWLHDVFEFVQSRILFYF